MHFLDVCSFQGEMPTLNFLLSLITHNSNFYQVFTPHTMRNINFTCMGKDEKILLLGESVKNDEKLSPLLRTKENVTNQSNYPSTTKILLKASSMPNSFKITTIKNRL